MHLLACFTLFDNEPRLVNTILGGFMEVNPDAVQSVAHKLLTLPNRSIVNSPAGEERGGMMASAPRSEDKHVQSPRCRAERPVIWPPRTHKTLPNGLEVVLVESHTIPKFTGSAFLAERKRRHGRHRAGSGGYDRHGRAHGHHRAQQPADRRRPAPHGCGSFLRAPAQTPARFPLPGWWTFRAAFFVLLPS